MTFKRSTTQQVILAFFANFCSIGPSMTIGFSAVAIPTLISVLNANQISWFASMASLSAPFGCFFSGPIADRFGRRTAIFCINICCFLGWLAIYGAYNVSSSYQYSLLLVGRLLTGLSAGLSSAPATIYMAEVSSSKYRGVFTTWGSIYFSLGILLIYVLGFFLKESCDLMALLTCFLPCVGMLFVLFFVPESPSWLVRKDRLDEAKQNISRIFGVEDDHPEIQSEIERLTKTKGVKNYSEQKSIAQQMLRKVKYLLKPHCLRPFGIVLAFFFFQQFSGTFVIVFYAIDIVKKAGVTLDPYVTIVMVGLIRFLTSILLSFVSKRVGRRPLAIASGVGMALCMSTLGCYTLLADQGKIPEAFGHILSLVPLVALLLYFFTSTLGFLPLPFAFAAELFPTKIRGTASGFLSGFGYIFNFFIVKVYPSMVEWLGGTTVFFFFAGMALLGTIFLSCALPETRGKSLDEILEYFGEKKKCGTKSEEGDDEIEEEKGKEATKGRGLYGMA